jgi:hypothetical protein
MRKYSIAAALAAFALTSRAGAGFSEPGEGTQRRVRRERETRSHFERLYAETPISDLERAGIPSRQVMRAASRSIAKRQRSGRVRSAGRYS